MCWLRPHRQRARVRAQARAWILYARYGSAAYWLARDRARSARSGPGTGPVLVAGRRRGRASRGAGDVDVVGEAGSAIRTRLMRRMVRRSSTSPQAAGSVGNSYDNALAETINGLFKAEVIHRCRPWRSFEAVEFATLEGFDWFNTRRLLEPIGNVPPAEAEVR